MSKRSPSALRHCPAALASLDALFGQIGVFPAGEQVLQVPVALAVAHEHEKTFRHLFLLLFDPSHQLGVAFATA